jgi:hypothetical protein
MKATELLQQQVTVTTSIFRTIAGTITAEEWTACPAPGYHPPGFQAWHMVAVQDWVSHVAIRGAAEVRDALQFAHHPGVNPTSAPSAVSVEQANEIAHGVSRGEVLEYADAVSQSLVKWLGTIKEKDLYNTPDVHIHARRYPPSRMTQEFLDEVAEMHGWSIARLVSSPCIGHIRTHCGELEVLLELMRARAAG